MKDKSGFFLLIGSIAFIMIAIIITTILDKTKTSRTDTRARASKVATMTFLGRVNSYNDAESRLIVDNISFSDGTRTLGDGWSVAVPASFNPASYPSGTQVRIEAVPSSFQISTKSVSAIGISKR